MDAWAVYEYRGGESPRRVGPYHATAGYAQRAMDAMEPLNRPSGGRYVTHEEVYTEAPFGTDDEEYGTAGHTYYPVRGEAGAPCFTCGQTFRPSHSHSGYDLPHAYGWDWGCRCLRCTTTHREQRERRRKLSGPTAGYQPGRGV